MDLVTYWCAQVASKHKVLFQQQLLSVGTNTVCTGAAPFALREGTFTGPTQVSNLRVS